ncbi:MAG: ribonuclease [Sphingomonadaceae bacterium]
MAEWLFEAGIGEDRAALIEDGQIVEMCIDRHDGRPRIGAVLPARLTGRLPNSDRSILVPSERGKAEVVGRIPASVTQGQEQLVTVVREAIAEPGNRKAAVVIPAEPGAVAGDGPSLLAMLQGSDHPVMELRPHEPDQLEAFGWSEQLAEAESGLIPFSGGLLRMALTPAMTLFDVDGVLPQADLSIAGAAEVAKAVRRFDIGGSIGIDLPMPQAAGKPLKHAVAARIDALLPPPFERTAVNGFGFLQIVRRRVRQSLPELLRSDPVTAAALALLRRAERTSGRGTLTISAAPAVIRRIAACQDWQNDLARRRGCMLLLSEMPGAAISDNHVQTEHP